MQRTRKELGDESLILARKYKDEGKLARSFAHYLVHWQIAQMSLVQSCPLQEVINVFDQLTLNLEAQERSGDLLSTYQQAIDVLPSDHGWIFRKIFLTLVSLCSDKNYHTITK